MAKQIKRLISIVCALAMVFSVSGIHAYAETKENSISIGIIQAEPGESVNVPILLSGNTGICAAKIVISYADGLELTSVSSGEALQSLTFTKPGDLKANPFNLVWDGVDADTSNGTIATLTFTAPNEAGDYDISMSYDDGDIIDGNLTPLGVNMDAGKIIVSGSTVHTHQMDKVEAKKATCTEPGNKEYYVCSDCKELFEDAEGKVSTTKDAVVLPALNHNYSAWTKLDENQHQKVCANDETHVEKAAHEWNGGEVTEEATETKKGVKTYTCTVCGATRTEDIPELAHTHELEKVVATSATCTAEGNSEYWKCTKCGKFFSDAEGATEIQKDSWITPKAAHKTVEKQLTNCKGETTGSYWECSDCHKTFEDQEGTKEITVSAIGHTLSKVTAKDSNCTEDGNVEHYACSVCGKNFSDSEGNTEIVNVVLPKLNHQMKKTDRKEASCTEDGNIEYYTCESCKQVFRDRAGTQLINQEATVISAKGHELEAVAASDATCTEPGNIAHWRCKNCGTLFSDAEGKKTVSASEVTISATGHNMVKVEAKAATATADGNIEYYRCTTCNKLFADAQGTTELKQADTVVTAKAVADAKENLNKETADIADLTNGKDAAVAESYQALQNAVKEAEDLINSGTANEEQLKQALEKVEAAKQDTAKAVVKSATAEAAKVSNKDNTYTAESYQALQNAIKEANALANDKSATVEQLKAAKSKVEAAQAALKKEEKTTADTTDKKTAESDQKTTDTSGQQTKEKTLKTGTTETAGSQYFTVSNQAKGSKAGAVIFKEAKNKKTVTVPNTVKLSDGKTYKVTQIAAKAFKGKKIRNVIVGANIQKISKNAFAKSKVTTVTIKSKKLTKKAVKNCFKSSKVKKIIIKVGSKKQNKQYIKKYKKIFTRKIAGKKVTIK